MIRLYHPQHGYHVLTYGDDEAEFEQNGWSREDAEQPEKLEEARSEQPKRRGRPRKEQ